MDGATPRRFKLTGPVGNGDVQLTDAANGVTATCSDQADELSCVMHYTQGIDLNDAAAERQIAATLLSPARQAELRAARDELQHQAVGIIIIKRR